MSFLNRLKKVGQKIGPGIIAGASDDDPSGILTYLQSGFLFGFKALWLTLFCLPLMYAIQEMAARIGYVTDKGLAKVIKEHYPKWILYIISLISIGVIAINIGADFLAIGIIAEKLTSFSRFFWILAASVFILFFTIFFSYPKFASLMKWLTLSLFFYIPAAFYLKIDWKIALERTLFPFVSFSKDFLVILAAFLGTTISPYLFFWQANEEVEDRDQEKKTRHLKRFLVTKNELKNLKKDTFVGMFFSQLATWFIVASASEASILHGAREITNFNQAAWVLEPLLGKFAFLVFGLGIIGTGLIAIPVLAGSIGYILSEAFGWREGINKTFREAKKFYAVIIFSIFVGAAMNFLNLDPVKLLVYTAVLYTIITPPIVYLIVKIANQKKIMGKRTNSLLSNIFGWLTFGITLLTAVFLIYSFIF